ncbi:MAG TPA: glycosyltransferase family 2 protein [Opitutaceae bacterium]
MPGSPPPRLSVVTPLFNCLDRTQAMVESLRGSMPDWLSYEVILVDDGSTDGTREWLSTLGEPYRVVLNERNMGFGASTNRGAAVARGRILALLNNDLVLAPGWLGPMINALNELGAEAGLVGNVQLSAATREVDHAGIVIDRKGKPVHERALPGPASVALAPVRRVPAVTGACVLVRSDTWRALGGFDEAYVNGCEDVDLCLRARAAGLANVVVLSSRVLHHVSSSPGRKLRDEENTRRLVERWHRDIAVICARVHALEQFQEHEAEPRDFPGAIEAVWMATYLLHLHGVPTPRALDAAYLHMDVELARWQKMFSN